jgi:hypothetical protein
MSIRQAPPVEAAERVALRRWLRGKGIRPAKGTRSMDTQRLMIQVHRAGGEPCAIVRQARREVAAKRKATQLLLNREAGNGS